MENKKKKKMKYVPPTIENMMFESGCILAGSTNNIGASSGGWDIDGVNTGVSSGGWGIDGTNTGASTGTWSKDGGSGN